MQDSISLVWFSAISSLRNCLLGCCISVYLPSLFLLCLEKKRVFLLSFVFCHSPWNPIVMISTVEEHEEGLFVLTLMLGNCSKFSLVFVLWDWCLIIPSSSFLHHSFYKLAFYCYPVTFFFFFFKILLASSYSFRWDTKKYMIYSKCGVLWISILAKCCFHNHFVLYQLLAFWLPF